MKNQRTHLLKRKSMIDSSDKDFKVAQGSTFIETKNKI